MAARTDLSGRAALVTGGSRGIGLAIARALHDAGAAVCLTGRRQASLDEAREKIGGDRVLTVAGSTTDPDHRAAAVGATVGHFGGIDMLVNNAATNAQLGPLVEASPNAVLKTVEADLLAPLGWVQEAWRQAMSTAGGSILNIGSIGGIRAGRNLGAYNVSKAGLFHLTRQLALELGPRVRVNALALGLVETDMSAALLTKGTGTIGALHPLGRIGRPADVAPLAAMLLSDAAGWVTGEVVTIDGGGTSLAEVGSTVCDALAP